MGRSPTLAILCLTAVWAVGCDDEEAPSGSSSGGSEQAEQGDPSGPTEAPGEAPSRAELLHLADRRVPAEHFEEALGHGDPSVRRTAARALARLHDRDAVPLLARRLRDPDPVVRQHASLGLGALEEGAPPGTERHLLAALASEQDTATREAILWDLGRVGTTTALPAFREALAGNQPALRAAACLGLGGYGLRSRALDPQMVRRIATRAVDDPEVRVRRACAYALTRIAPPPLDREGEGPRPIVRDLGRAAEDAEPDVRAFAVRALGRYPDAPADVLEEATRDPDWTVTVQGFRALSRVTRGGSDVRMARALRVRIDRALAPEHELHGPTLHVLLAALRAAGPFARQTSTHGVAQEAYERLGKGDPPDRDRALAHCAAAELVDLGREWPARLEDCGFGKVPEGDRQAAMARVLGASEGASEERAAYLSRLFDSESARAREAVLAAVPSAAESEAARDLVLEGLSSGDVGVITAAADALAKIERAPSGASDPSRDPADRTRFPVGRLKDALGAAHRALTEGDEVEGLQSWLGAVEATQARGLLEPVRGLVTHHSPAVRSRARATLESLGAEVPEAERDDPPNPLPPKRFPAADAELRAHLETDRGTVVLELLAGPAPATVARFVGLARDGFYDGLAFHRVVPAFVVQGGDPRGDGYGGPGWTQRCEDNRVRYERGTVGMALAGRDTGGSQFFITHTRQPHLDGRYTPFARVTDGMDVVDRWQRGDRIRSVQIREVSRENDQD